MDLTRREFIADLPLLAYLLGHPLELAKTPRILINPGHNKRTANAPGERYISGVGSEHELNTRISEKLANELASRSGIEAVLSRDDAEYTKEIRDFYSPNRMQLEREVRNYRRAHKPTTNLTVEDAALQLGILKWANMSGFDAVVNIHINFYGDEDPKRKSSCFAVFFSDINSPKSSMDLALRIYNSLKERFIPSNNESESMRGSTSPITLRGIATNRLIMTGSELHPVQVPSVMIECGYLGQKYADGKTIADSQVQRAYAQQISKGIIRYFG